MVTLHIALGMIVETYQAKGSCSGVNSQTLYLSTAKTVNSECLNSGQ